MELSIDGIALIKHWEGCRLQPYLCANGRWTIGIGHLILPNERAAYARGIDMITAERLFRQDVKHHVDIVNHATTGIITKQNQFDVLVSFSFNVGINAFLNSTLLDMIQIGKFDAVPAQLMRWIHGDNGKVIEGLKRRRTMDCKIWNGEKIEILLGLRRR